MFGLKKLTVSKFRNSNIEPIQSRCAVLRFTRLNDAQILARLMEVCRQESVNDL